MDPRIATSSPTTGMAGLRAVPEGEPDRLTAALDEAERDDLDRALLRDAATLVTARRRLDELLLQLTANPFDPAAYRGLGSYLIGPGPLALAAYQRVSTAAATRDA